MTRSEFERLIRESGREPFERDAEYRRIVRDGPIPAVPPHPETVPLPA
jgi:2-iminoacetate synthase ThiH